jgi:hypothetical protein
LEKLVVIEHQRQANEQETSEEHDWFEGAVDPLCLPVGAGVDGAHSLFNPGCAQMISEDEKGNHFAEGKQECHEDRSNSWCQRVPVSPPAREINGGDVDLKGNAGFQVSVMNSRNLPIERRQLPFDAV